MKQEYLTQLLPSVQKFDDKSGLSSAIAGIDVMEVTPMSSSIIAKHAGENGEVFADTRLRKPAQYRVILAVPESDVVIQDVHKNLLDASWSPMQKYTVTSYFSRCWDMVVVSSRNTDKADQQGLRLQEVVFEECFVYEATNTYTLDQVDNVADSSTQSQPIQNTNISS